MPLVEFKNYYFKYSTDNTINKHYALTDISLNIEEGEFVVIAGPTGSGKTTLLRSIKKEVLQQGIKKGKVLYNGKDIQEVSDFDSACEIGMVFQNPDNQLVMETVLEELCFSLENIGLPTKEIRKRVAEISMYFGLHEILHKKVSELSGGQKQLVNLASVLVLRPKIFLLDEPLSQLDSSNSFNFLNHIKRINEELKITIIMTSHRLEKLYKIASKMIYLDSGRILENKIQLYESVNDSIIDIESKPTNQRRAVLELKSIKFSYDNNKPILKNISLCIREGEVLTILGENGAGKTTFLQLLVDLLKPNEGKILKTKDTNFFYISQNTNLHFLFDTVKDELLSINNEIEQISKKLCIEHILNSHPLDISIGEQQKVLLAMAILSKANIIILDEPTKALDEICRIQVGEEIERLKNCGVAIIMATHDIDFAKRYSDRNMLLFDGELINL